MGILNPGSTPGPPDISTVGKYFTVAAIKRLPDELLFILDNQESKEVRHFFYCFGGRIGFYFFRKGIDSHWFYIASHFVAQDTATFFGIQSITLYSKKMSTEAAVRLSNIGLDLPEAFWKEVGALVGLPLYDHMQLNGGDTFITIPQHDIPGHAGFNEANDPWIPSLNLSARFISLYDSEKLVNVLNDDSDKLFVQDNSGPVYIVNACMPQHRVEVMKLARTLEPLGPQYFKHLWGESMAHPNLGLLTIAPSYELEDRGKLPPVGYLAAYLTKKYSVIYSCAISPDFRRQGLAQKLLSQFSFFYSRQLSAVLVFNDYIIEAGLLLKKCGYKYGVNEEIYIPASIIPGDEQTHRVDIGNESRNQNLNRPYRIFCKIKTNPASPFLSSSLPVTGKNLGKK